MFFLCFGVLSNFFNLQKQVELEKNKQQDEQNSLNDTEKLLQDLRNLGESSHSKARQAEISRRIGFEPHPITPETTSHYQNLH